MAMQEKVHKYASVPQEEEQCPQPPSPSQSSPPPPYSEDEGVLANPPTLKHRLLLFVAVASFIIAIVKFLHIHPTCGLPSSPNGRWPRPPFSPFAPNAPVEPVEPVAPDAPVPPVSPFSPVGPVMISTKVPLEAHIMSKCPDAKDCLRDLVVPAMEKISDKVDFKLSYIGRLVDQDDSVECMHGPEECLGNIIELCAADLYPDPKISLGFTMCMTEQYSDIPQKELVKECALEYGVDFDKLNDCVSKDDGAFGMKLLRNSVARTSDADVVKSCTVRLDGYIRCIRDGGEWKNCTGGHEVEDLVRDVNDLNAVFEAVFEVADAS